MSRQWVIRRLMSGWGVACCTPHQASNEAEETVFTEETPWPAIAGLVGSEPALLAIGGWDCLFGRVDVAPDERPDRQTLAFALEEQLPISAEEFTADYAPLGSEHACVAAIDDRVAPVIEGLLEAGVELFSVTPWATLVATEALRQRAAESAEELLLHGDAEFLHWLVVKEDAIAEWRVVRNAEADVAREFAWRRKQCPLPPVRLLGEVSWPEDETTPSGSAADAMRFGLDAAQRILRGEQRPLFELLRERLRPEGYRGRLGAPLVAMALAASVLLATFAGVTAVRTWDHHRLAAEGVREQQRLFQEALPGERVPVGLRGRLASVARGLQGQQSAADGPERERGFLFLARLLSAVPEDVPHRLVELRMERGAASVELQARSHTAAERIAAALRSAGYEVEPPRSQQLQDRGVSVRIDCQTPGKDKKS